MSDLPKFRSGDMVRHVKTGGIYVVLYDCHKCLLEKDLTPCYVYADALNEKIWVRPQEEMEDGRFERYVPAT